jgi:hypothetical protein
LFNKGDDEGGVTRRRLFVTGRHIERPGTYVLQREPGKAAFQLVGEEGDFVRGEMEQQVLRLLQISPPMTPAQLAKAVGRARSRIQHVVEALVEKKLVHAVRPGTYTTATRQLAAAVGAKDRCAGGRFS